MIRWRDAGLLGAGLAAGLVFASPGTAAPPVVVPAPPGTQGAQTPLPPAPLPPGMAAAPAAPGGCPEPVTLQRLSDTTMVAVKDHGDSQTVLVYTFDEDGVMKPTPQKMRFFYRP